MVKRVLVTSMVTAGVFCLSAGAAPVNRLPNAGFDESGGWTEHSPNANIVSSQYIGTYNGDGMLKMTEGGSGDAEMRCDEVLLVRPNCDYEMGMYTVTRNNGVSDWVELNYEVMNEAVDTVLRRLSVEDEDIPTDEWSHHTDTFSNGNREKVTVRFMRDGTVDRYVDDVSFSGDDTWYQPGAYNGSLDENKGWLFSGEASFKTDRNRSGSGSGCIQLKDQGSTHFARQWMEVTPNTDYTLNWYSLAWVSGDNPKHSTTITGMDDESTLASNKYASTSNTTWSEHELQFNSGNNEKVYVQFTSESYGRRAIDDITLVPEPATFAVLLLGSVFGIIRKR